MMALDPRAVAAQPILNSTNRRVDPTPRRFHEGTRLVKDGEKLSMLGRHPKNPAEIPDLTLKKKN